MSAHANEQIDLVQMVRDQLSGAGHLASADREREVEPGVTRGELRRELEREEGLRRVCQFCKGELPGSNVTAARTSHGACRPLCDAARAMGWGD